MNILGELQWVSSLEENSAAHARAWTDALMHAYASMFHCISSQSKRSVKDRQGKHAGDTHTLIHHKRLPLRLMSNRDFLRLPVSRLGGGLSEGLRLRLLRLRDVCMCVCGSGVCLCGSVRLDAEAVHFQATERLALGPVILKQ